MRMNFQPVSSVQHPDVVQAGQPNTALDSGAKRVGDGDPRDTTNDPHKTDEGGGANQRVAIEVTGAAKDALINTLIGGTSGRINPPRPA